MTINDRSVVIAFSKEIVAGKTIGNMGLDVNERNVTTSETSGVTKVFDTSEVAEIKERYRVIRAKIGGKTRRDNRISQKLYSKYGRREGNRTVQRIHRISNAIVGRADAKRLAIVMEKLKGIRRLYRRGNGQGTQYRGWMNSWTFREVQRQIEYKARWKGVPVTYVNPRGTSRNCPDCGSPLLELEERRLLCPSCKQIGDRDVIASRNIMASVVPEARPSRGSREGERGDDGFNPRSRWMEVGLSNQSTTLTEPSEVSASGLDDDF